MIPKRRREECWSRGMKRGVGLERRVIRTRRRVGVERRAMRTWRMGCLLGKTRRRVLRLDTGSF